MFDIDEAKLPPPRPDRKASSWKTHSGVSWLQQRESRADRPGIINSEVVKKMVFRPPAIRMKKLLGIRRLAPVRPAIAVIVKSSD